MRLLVNSSYEATSFVEGGTPKFEDHVTLNEDEYQKSLRLKFRYCLGSIVIHRESFDYMHTGGGDLKLAFFTTLGPL